MMILALKYNQAYWTSYKIPTDVHAASEHLLPSADQLHV